MQEQKAFTTEQLIKLLEITKDFNIDSISHDHKLGKPKNRADDVFDSRRDLIRDVQEEIKKRLKIGMSNV